MPYTYEVRSMLELRYAVELDRAYIHRPRSPELDLRAVAVELVNRLARARTAAFVPTADAAFVPTADAADADNAHNGADKAPDGGSSVADFEAAMAGDLAAFEAGEQLKAAVDDAQLAALARMHATALAELGARHAQSWVDRTPLGADEAVVQEVTTATGLSCGDLGLRLELATGAPVRVAFLREQVATGATTLHRACQLVAATRHVPDDLLGDVLRAVLAPTRDGAGLPPARFRQRLRRALVAADTASGMEADTRKAARQRIGVFARLYDDGTGTLSVTNDADKVAAAYDRADAAARAARQGGDPRSLDELRADFLTGAAMAGWPDERHRPATAGAEQTAQEGQRSCAATSHDLEPFQSGCAGASAASEPSEPSEPSASSASSEPSEPSEPERAGPPAPTATATETADSNGQARVESEERTVAGAGTGSATGDGRGRVAPAGRGTGSVTPTAKLSSSATSPPGDWSAQSRSASQREPRFGPIRAHPPAKAWIVVPWSTAAGLADDPCELPGHGWVSAAQAREIITAEGSVWHRLLADVDTGRALSLTRRGYRPTAEMIEHVRAVDGTCRAPACDVLAIRCDIDHSAGFDHRDPEATTHLAALGALDRAHHRLRTAGWWRAAREADGEVAWRTSAGRRYLTYPRDWLDGTRVRWTADATSATGPTPGPHQPTPGPHQEPYDCDPAPF